MSEYLTVGEAASLLSLSQKAVRCMISVGKLQPAIRRIGRRILISRVGLLQIVESGALSQTKRAQP